MTLRELELEELKWLHAREMKEAFPAEELKPYAAMEALCTYLQKQAPILPVCFKSTSVLVQTDVAEGLTPTMAEPFYDLSSCVFHLREEP